MTPACEPTQPALERQMWICDRAAELLGLYPNLSDREAVQLARGEWINYMRPSDDRKIVVLR
jgi:hypothetical protein